MRDAAVAPRGRPLRRMRATTGRGAGAIFLGARLDMCVSSTDILIYEAGFAIEIAGQLRAGHGALRRRSFAGERPRARNRSLSSFDAVFTLPLAADRLLSMVTCRVQKQAQRLRWSRHARILFMRMPRECSRRTHSLVLRIGHEPADSGRHPPFHLPARLSVGLRARRRGARSKDDRPRSRLETADLYGWRGLRQGREICRADSSS